MHQEPYYDHYPKIKELSFEQFVQFSIEDYENPIAMWNQKNASYLCMAAEVPNAIIIPVEKFHAAQEVVHSEIQTILGQSDVPFIRIQDYVNGRGLHDQKDIEFSLAIPNLDQNTIELINASLSPEILKQCNYQKI